MSAGLPRVIGHRGAAKYAPENTLASFRRARAQGCRWVEFDVRLTADGSPVVLHDSRLERTTDGIGRVSALPLAAIRGCDAGLWFDRAFAGEPVPTLEEALALLTELGLGANIELKADRGFERATGAVAALAVSDWLVRHSAPPVLLSSFLPQALVAARERVPAVPLGILFRTVPRHWLRIARRLGCATINARQQNLRPSVVAEIRDAGFPLLAYTVNDPLRARILFGWGVTSVFTDAPDIILAGAPGGDICITAPSGRQGATRRQGAAW